MKNEKSGIVSKITASSAMSDKHGKLSELIRVYQDLERTLKALKANAERSVVAESINMRKLIDRLSKSKRVLERKIGEALAAEKAHIRKRFNRLIKA